MFRVTIDLINVVNVILIIVFLILVLLLPQSNLFYKQYFLSQIHSVIILLEHLFLLFKLKDFLLWNLLLNNTQTMKTILLKHINRILQFIAYKVLHPLQQFTLQLLSQFSTITLIKQTQSSLLEELFIYQFQVLYLTIIML